MDMVVLDDGQNHVANYCVEYLHEAIAKELISVNLKDTESVMQCIMNAFVAFDKEMYEIRMRYGSTCTAILIDYVNRIIYQIDLGDSRSIIFNRIEQISVTVDHHPDIGQETERITHAGGIVLDNRVDGSLAVSRAFGDFAYKTTTIDGTYSPTFGKVSALPTIVPIPITEHMFCILTSDAPYEKRHSRYYPTPIILDNSC